MTTRNRTNRNEPVTASDLAARHSRSSRRTSAEDETPPRRKRAPGGNKRRSPRRKSAPQGERVIGPFLKAIVSLVVFVGLVTAGAVAFRSLVGSTWFTVKHIEVEGTERTSREEVTALIESKTAGGLWKTDLVALRDALKKNAWIRDVEITRLPPDRLRVRVNERAPFVLARRENNDIVWLDRDGTVLGEQARFTVENVPPLVTGLPEGAATAIQEKRRKQLDAVQQLLNELGNGSNGATGQSAASLIEQVDEITYTEANGIELRVQAGQVRVLVGTQDYRKRLNAALHILEAVARRDVTTLQLFKLSDAERLLQGTPIAYINATLPDRAVVGFAQ